MDYNTALLIAIFILGVLMMISAVEGNTGTMLCCLLSPAHTVSS